MLSPSPSSWPTPLPQPTHPPPYNPPPTTVNDPPSSVGYGFLVYISSFLPLLLVCFCFACSQCNANQPQPQDIEQGGPRNPPQQQQQQQQQQAPRGVTGTVVKYRSHDNIGNCSDCAICLDDFREGEQCRVLDGCRHMYHKACINKWLARDKHCPLCRGSVRGGERSNHQNQIWTELQTQENMI